MELSQAFDLGNPIQDNIIPDDKQPVNTISMQDAMKQYSMNLEFTDVINQKRDAGTLGEIGAGLERFYYGITDIPDNVKNATIRAFNGHIFPNMTENQATMLMESVTREQMARNQYRQRVEQIEGIDPNSITANLTSGIAQAVFYGLTGNFLGGVGMGIEAGLQVAGESNFKYAENYLTKKGSMEGYKGTDDFIYSSLNGAINGYIEQALGVENLFQNTLSKFTKGAGKQLLSSAIEEGAEEYLQEVADYTIGKIADNEGEAYRETRTFGEMQKDALVNAVYGAVIGGAVGSSLYIVNRGRISKALQEQYNMSEPEALQTATEIIENGTSKTLEEVQINTELRNSFGDSFEALKTKINNAIISSESNRFQTQEQLDSYVDLVAKDIGLQVINNAKMFNIPTSDYLDLANIQNYDNIISLERTDLSDLDTVKDLIKSKKERVKELNLKQKTGIDTKAERSVLNRQIAQLQVIKNKLKPLTEEQKTNNPVLSDILGNKLNNITLTPQTQILETIPELINNDMKQDLKLAISNINKENFADVIKDSNNNIRTNAFAYAMTYGNPQQVKDFFINYSQKVEANKESDLNLTDRDLILQTLDESDIGTEQDKRAVHLSEVESVNNTVEKQLYQEPYTQKTINIDGVEKSAVNSEGNPLGKTEQDIRNFYKWFGDSKVVDEQGRPLVVYHGTTTEFNEFSSEKIGQSGVAEGVGFYFTPDKNIAKDYGNTMSLYLKLENPVYAYSQVLAKNNSKTIQNASIQVLKDLKAKGYEFYDETTSQMANIATETNYDSLVNGIEIYIKDGIKTEDYDQNKLYNDIRESIINNFGFDGFKTENYGNTEKPVYIAFEPNQIKSVDNIGTYSSETGNIYQQENKINTYKTSDRLESIFKELGYKVRKVSSQASDSMYLYISSTEGESLHTIRISNHQSTGSYQGEMGSPDFELGYHMGADAYSIGELLSQIKDVDFSKSRKAQNDLNKYQEELKLREEVKEQDKRAVHLSEVESVNNSVEKQLYQVAYAGSRVDYDSPSLDAIGSGEGMQAHGWGLYYAIDQKVADDYRKIFMSVDQFDNVKNGNYKYNILLNGEEMSIDDLNMFYEKSYYADTNITTFIDTLKKQNQEQKFLGYINQGLIPELEFAIEVLEDNPNMAINEFLAYNFSERIERIVDDFQENGYITDGLKNELENQLEYHNKEKRYNDILMDIDKIEYKPFPKANLIGQVHEVDIPEMEVLLDEQKSFEKQNNFVKEQLEKINTESEAKGFLNSLRSYNTDDKIDGYDIYKKISNYVNGNRQASQLLEKYGIKGITYEGKSDGRCFVIFNSDDVKVLRKKFDELGQQLFQQRQQENLLPQNVNGFMDTELKTIVLGSNLNEGTLPHEFAHFFLQKNFELWKTKDNTQFDELAKQLGITKDQDSLTREQQEQFAYMTESYLFGKGIDTDPIVKAYLNWIPSEYNSIYDMGYRKADGTEYNPIISDSMKEYFDNVYSALATITSPKAESYTNPTDKEEKPLASDFETRKERVADIKKEVVIEPVKYDSQDMATITRTELSTENMADKWITSILPGKGTNTREQQLTLATDWIANNRTEAEQIAFGNFLQTEPDFVANTSPVERSFIYRALMNEYSKDSVEYARLNHNLATYLSTQGKASGLNNDLSYRLYLDNYAKLTNILEEKASFIRYGKSNQAVKLFNADIDKFVATWMDSVLRTKTDSNERDIAIQNFIESAKQEFGDDTILEQAGDYAKLLKKATKNNYQSIARKLLKEIAKASPSSKQQIELLRLAERAQKMASGIDSNDPKTAVASAKAIKEFQDYIRVEKLPESFMQKVIGAWMPRAMLSSPSTHLTNAISNTFQMGIIKSANRAYYGENIVSKQVMTAEKNRLKQIYKETGYNLAQQFTLTDQALLKGEKYETKPSKEMKWYDPIRLLGDSDFIFRNELYIDTLAHIASRNAKGNVQEANRLFNEYKRLSTTDESSLDVRKEALLVANIGVFTQNGKFASILTQIRNSLDMVNIDYSKGVQIGVKGNKGLGTMLAPFIKTPANIIELGARAIISPFTTINTLAKGEKLSISQAIDLTTLTTATLAFAGFILAGAKYQGTDDPYDPKNDTIQFGSLAIKLDNFGVMGQPLRQVFSLYKTSNIKNDDWVNTGISDLPLFSEVNKIQLMRDDFSKFANDFTAEQFGKIFPSITKPITKKAINIKPDNRYLRKWTQSAGLTQSRTAIDDWTEALSKVVFGSKIQFR